MPLFVKSSLVLGALPDAQGVRLLSAGSRFISNLIIQVAAWLPMNTVSQAVLDIGLSVKAPTIALNIVHPRPSRWSAIIESIADALHRTGITQDVVPLVPFSEWLGRLEQRSQGADAVDMANIVSVMTLYVHSVTNELFQPAIKLLDFFRGMVTMDEGVRQSGRTDMEVGLATLSTIKSQAASKAMAEVQSIGKDDAQLWVKYWASKGFFN